MSTELRSGSGARGATAAQPAPAEGQAGGAAVASAAQPGGAVARTQMAGVYMPFDRDDTLMITGQPAGPRHCTRALAMVGHD